MSWRGRRGRIATRRTPDERTYRSGGGDGGRGPTPLRSFALGGLLGAAGAVATVRRLRRASRVAQVAGLAAFETAPCFVELDEREYDASAPDGDATG
jgi:hypothetical protein